MLMAADWSSLPSELVGVVADALVATGDVECYRSLRAVCHNWRGATADPRSPDPRFLPRRWVMLRSRATNVQDSRRRLFLNVDTGRFVWKDLPVLDDPSVATDNDGLLILQGPSDSEEIYALNPFTGASIRFPMHTAYAPSGRVVAAGSSPMVVLYSFPGQDHGTSANLNSKFVTEWIFPAKPALDSFASVVSSQGRVYAMDRKGTVVLMEDRCRVTTIVAGDWQGDWRPAFLVDNAGELLAVRAPTFQDIVQVFKVDLENKALHMIKNIGNRAIFLGTRPLSVNVDNLPAIEANCIYYIGGAFESKHYGIYMHRLEDGNHEKLYEPTDIALPVMLVWNRERRVHPLSLPHVLLEYATYEDMLVI